MVLSFSLKKVYGEVNVFISCYIFSGNMKFWEVTENRGYPGDWNRLVLAHWQCQCAQCSSAAVNHMNHMNHMLRATPSYWEEVLM